MAFSVSIRLTITLSSNSFDDNRSIKALATFPGLGINPSAVVYHSVIVIATCSITMMMNVCLFIFLNG
jgi:hypothetical protein